MKSQSTYSETFSIINNQIAGANIGKLEMIEHKLARTLATGQFHEAPGIGAQAKAALRMVRDEIAARREITARQSARAT